VKLTDKLSTHTVNLWSLRNRLNGLRLDGTHTVQGLLGNPTLMREHPEYYAQNEKGERLVNGEYEGCYTDPGFIKLLTAYALERMEKTDAEVISLSQTDFWWHCKCARCKEVNQKYGNTGAAAVCLALNQVAEETSKRFPNRGVQAYAYLWSRKPPQGMPKLHPNVYIKLAPINRSIGHPLGEGGPAVNAEIGQDLRDWHRLTDNLCVWNYTVNGQYFLLPLPNIPTVAESGVPGFDVSPWIALYLPAGTQADVVRALTGYSKSFQCSSATQRARSGVKRSTAVCLGSPAKIP
jgi:phage FluMu protein Com